MSLSPFRRCAAASCWFTLVLALAGCVVQTVPAPAPVQQGAPPPEAPPEAPPPSTSRAYPPGALVDVGQRTDVALLLPLSGVNRSLGNDMLNAAQMALSELGGDEMALTPKDTGGTPDGAVDAAQRAIAEGAKLIIGPLTASEVEAIAPTTRQAGVNVISFSNQARVAGNGVFVLGFLPSQAAQRIAAYGHSTGINHFAVLASSSTYGTLIAQSFKEAVEAAGGTVDNVQYYAPGSSGSGEAIKGLTSGGKPSFTGLLVEATPDRLKTMAALLPQSGISQPDIRLLGTDAWDTSDLGSEPALIGGWYAATPPDARAGFERRFAQAYGHKPLALAALAYDAVGIAAVLAHTPGGNFTTEALTSPSGFAGAEGVFRLLPDGTTQRGLAVMQVERSGTPPSVVSPAPESFEAVSQ